MGGFSIETTGGITLAGIATAIGGAWRLLFVPLQMQINELKVCKADISLCAEKHKTIDQNVAEIKADLREVKEGINDIALLLATKEQKGN